MLQSGFEVAHLRRGPLHFLLGLGELPGRLLPRRLQLFFFGRELTGELFRLAAQLFERALRLRQFSGKRLRVQTKFESCEPDCYALLVWCGRGKLNGVSLKAGDEFFVTAGAAGQPHMFENTGNETLEVFKFFAAAVK